MLAVTDAMPSPLTPPPLLGSQQDVMIIYFKALAKETGKIWVMHIALYIAPRMVAKCAPASLHMHTCTHK